MPQSGHFQVLSPSWENTRQSSIFFSSFLGFYLLDVNYNRSLLCGEPAAGIIGTAVEVAVFAMVEDEDSTALGAYT